MSFVSHDGIDLYYETHGSGERTLVFAHGMGGNAAIWFNQVAEFAADYRIITFDHRHFGRSRCDVSEFTPAKFPGDALAILDQEKIDSAVFVCQSMGGWTGTQLALDHADRVEALVLSHTPGVFVHEAAVNDQRRLAAVLETGHLPALAADFPDKNPVMTALYGAINRFNDTVNAEVARAIGNAGLRCDLAKLEHYDVPTLFITSDKDVMFEASFIRALADNLPGARFINLGDVGHSSYFERPDDFNRVLREFLESAGQRAQPSC